MIVDPTFDRTFSCLIALQLHLRIRHLLSLPPACCSLYSVIPYLDIQAALWPAPTGDRFISDGSAPLLQTPLSHRNLCLICLTKVLQSLSSPAIWMHSATCSSLLHVQPLFVALSKNNKETYIYIHNCNRKRYPILCMVAQWRNW